MDKRIIYKLQTTVYRFAPLMRQKKNLLIVAATFWILLVTIPFLFEVYGQGPPPSQGPPKVDVFARQTAPNAILVTWENPSDTADNIVFRYTVSKEVNRSDTFVPIFDSLRDLDEKVIDESNGQEMFFFLDEDIVENTFYAYRISAGRTQGNPNPNLSDDTRPIFIEPNIQFRNTESNAHLITGRTLTPLPALFIAFFNFNWLIQDASAAHSTNPIFTTTLNPQNESFLLALEPVTSNPNVTNSFTCSQVLQFSYQNSAEGGQNFNLTATITENQIPKHQEIFHGLTTSTKRLFQDQLAITPLNQVIQNFSALEVQFDITGTSGDPRQLSVWDVVFKIPHVEAAC